MEVIDNFLPEDVFLQTQDFITSSYFPWYFNSHTVEGTAPDTLDYQLIHNFYTLEEYGRGIGSSFFDKVEPIIKKLNCFCLLRVKANLRTLYQGSQNKQGVYYHRDYEEFDCTTAIFYITTNNGYTIFKETGEKVDCVANRLVKFDAKLEHAGISANDSKQRIVINFNYIE